MADMKLRRWMGAVCVVAAGLGVVAATAKPMRAQAVPQLVILDTDIGDDIDDAFALALVLQSPELKLLGVTTAFGDTALRARLVDRYLTAVGRGDVPIAAGVTTPAKNVFTQRVYAERGPQMQFADGVDFLLGQIRAHPGEITLIAIGPLTNVQAAIARDPETFKQLKRVVLMGGSIERGYDGNKTESGDRRMRSGISSAIRPGRRRC